MNEKYLKEQERLQKQVYPELPKEASLSEKARETYSYLEQIESELATMRGILFSEGEEGLKGKSPSSGLAQSLSDCSRTAATILGELKTINSRL